MSSEHSSEDFCALFFRIASGSIDDDLPTSSTWAMNDLKGCTICIQIIGSSGTQLVTMRHDGQWITKDRTFTDDPKRAHRPQGRQ